MSEDVLTDNAILGSMADNETIERVVYAAAWGSAFGHFQSAEWATETRRREADRDAEHASIVAQAAVDRFRSRNEQGKLWHNQRAVED